MSGVCEICGEGYPVVRFSLKERGDKDFRYCCSRTTCKGHMPNRSPWRHIDVPEDQCGSLDDVNDMELMEAHYNDHDLQVLMFARNSKAKALRDSQTRIDKLIERIEYLEKLHLGDQEEDEEEEPSA